MYSDAKETARLYRVLTEKLGSEITEAMFKYIDNKTERSVEASIKKLATKEHVSREIANVRKEAGANKADLVKWMFIFWVGQVGVTLGIVLLFLKR